MKKIYMLLAVLGFSNAVLCAQSVPELVEGPDGNNGNNGPVSENAVTESVTEPVSEPVPELVEGPGGTDVSFVDTLTVDSLERAAFESVIEEKFVNWYSEVTFTDSCFNNPVKEPLTKEEYVQRMSEIPAEMELSYNQVVRSYIDSYVHRYPKNLSKLLGLSQ
ncbi:MAG: hypothetical protein UIC45_03285, partial [Paludibacteraceae bacterium]|nr:hypothetical protein [Paludibacteraceae bacterium]